MTEFSPHKFIRQRKRAGISTERVAMLCNLSKQTVWNWESGKAVPGVDNLWKAVKAMGCSMIDVCRGVSDLDRLKVAVGEMDAARANYVEFMEKSDENVS